MDFELRHLRYFVAVAEMENISRASKRLHISQPPLSRQIRYLEDAVGIPLFDRGPKMLRLTKAGGVFLHEARGILERVEDASALAKRAGQQDDARIRIGHSAAASIVALPNILREAHRLHSNAKIELRTMTTERMIRSLRRGELDLCLSVCDTVQHLNEFTVTPIDTYGLVAAVSKHHPFVDLAKVSMEALVQQPIISLTQTRHPWFNAYIKDVLSVHGSSYDVVEEHDSDDGVLAAVEAGRGVALLYDVMAHVVGRRLVLRRLAPTPRRAPLVLFHRPGQKGSFVRDIAHAARAIGVA
ncbi:LysR family transcriptional regulator [Acidisarcina polymorpha]|uniref:LysR family transcriptional regulator n=1 Tax=Acidisarcina polymorpha TaxID=2211140 RepID=UPI000DEEB9BC|nr:LysR substrate-binding domain-containing protein [Acidisarcina polymorpha]